MDLLSFLFRLGVGIPADCIFLQEEKRQEAGQPFVRKPPRAPAEQHNFPPFLILALIQSHVWYLWQGFRSILYCQHLRFLSIWGIHSCVGLWWKVGPKHTTKGKSPLTSPSSALSLANHTYMIKTWNLDWGTQKQEEFRIYSGGARVLALSAGLMAADSVQWGIPLRMLFWDKCFWPPDCPLIPPTFWMYISTFPFLLWDFWHPASSFLTHFQLAIVSFYFWERMMAVWNGY